MIFKPLPTDHYQSGVSHLHLILKKSNQLWLLSHHRHTLTTATWRCQELVELPKRTSRRSVSAIVILVGKAETRVGIRGATWDKILAPCQIPELARKVMSTVTLTLLPLNFHARQDNLVPTLTLRHTSHPPVTRGHHTTSPSSQSWPPPGLTLSLCPSRTPQSTLLTLHFHTLVPHTLHLLTWPLHTLLHHTHSQALLQLIPNHRRTPPPSLLLTLIVPSLPSTLTLPILPQHHSRVTQYLHPCTLMLPPPFPLQLPIATDLSMRASMALLSGPPHPLRHLHTSQLPLSTIPLSPPCSLLNIIERISEKNLTGQLLFSGIPEFLSYMEYLVCFVSCRVSRILLCVSFKVLKIPIKCVVWGSCFSYLALLYWKGFQNYCYNFHGFTAQTCCLYPDAMLCKVCTK